MDPTTLIVTALTAGATELTKTAVKEAYEALKGLVQRKFAGKPEAEVALVQVEEKPEECKAPLKKAVEETGAYEDEAIVRAAERVLQLIQPQQASSGKYTIQIGEAQGVVIGDNAQVRQTFRRD